MSTDSRVCRKCLVEKPITEFRLQSKRKGLYFTTCTECGLTPTTKKKRDLAEAGLKECGKCRQILPFDRFSKRFSVGTSLRSKCKSCMTETRNVWLDKNPDYMSNHAKKYYYSNRELCQERNRRGRLKREYGLTVDDYNQILAEQKGLCSICKSDSPKGPPRMVIDHDHKTGSVRGLLCGPCNRALGFFEDDPSVLERAAEYLREPQWNPEESAQLSFDFTYNSRPELSTQSFLLIQGARS